METIVNILSEKTKTEYAGILLLEDANDSDHVHYCDKCKHWYACKQSEFRCEFISNSVTSHRKHLASMSVDED